MMYLIPLQYNYLLKNFYNCINDFNIGLYGII